jgi:two-component system, NtrC family, sensor kinase
VKIRHKVMALIAGIFLCLGLAEILVERQVIMPSFAALERASARTAMKRIEFALGQTLERLQLSATDWGNWADTYRFAADHNAAFIAANISPLALRQLQVNALLIVDGAGQIVLARDLDLDGERPLGLELTARQSLPPGFPWRANLAAGRPARGLLRSSRGVLLLAAAPILDGEGHGPVRGMVILGRLLSPAVLDGISQQAQTQLALAPTLTGAGGQQLEEDATTTRVFQSFDDIYGQPLLRLRVDVPRDISMRGHTAVLVASSCLFCAAITVLLLMLFVLHRMILAPLAAVTRHAVALGEDQDLTTRLDLARADEIGTLAREFDRMVDRVAQSRTQLVDQSYQAGFAELAKGVLHNLGNAMTPIGVRLANLGERLRQAPAEDAEQALAELRQDTPDSGRRADLEEFVRLGCHELAQCVHTAREDVELLSRQASAVQGTLSEQLRTTRNEHVVEPVRLTELVAQSLEIVPDSCRARLQINADETLRQVGVVRVARTVLRLILQNLIINAADAVRDAGKQRGVLRLSAEIVRDAQPPALHLLCQDDGVGIPPQDLRRVFEKGFTTKSPETNHGIGLHWCANAIGALGGQIWAVSDGPGRGAAMHLLVPLAGRDTAALAGAA